MSDSSFLWRHIASGHRKPALSANPPPIDRWEKIKILSGLFAAIAVPIVIAIVGQAIAVILKRNDVEIKVMELAIQILRDDPKNTPETPTLREWAMSVIDDYSGKKLPQKVKEELQQNPIVQERPPTRATSTKVTRCPTANAWMEERQDRQITVTETPYGCNFSVNGSSRLAASCQTVKASVFYTGSAMAMEHDGECVLVLN